MCDTYILNPFVVLKGSSIALAGQYIKQEAYISSSLFTCMCGIPFMCVHLYSWICNLVISFAADHEIF